MALALAAPAAKAVCTSRWRVDHYVRDAALHKDWAVLVNCDDPAAPARMEMVSNHTATVAASARGIAARRMYGSEGATAKRIGADVATEVCMKVGAAVEVSSAADSVVSMDLAGTAMETACRGQKVRVRLSADGHFVHAIVRGAHSVELAASEKPGWRQP